MSKGYETAQTKGTFKTRRHKQNKFISITKHTLIPSKYRYGSINKKSSVCGCITNTTTTTERLNVKSVLFMLKSYFKMFVFFLWFETVGVSEAELVKVFWRKWMLARPIHVAAFWRLLVKIVTLEGRVLPLQWKLGKRERVFEDGRIYRRNTCLEISSKKTQDENLRGRSFTQVTWFSWPMVSRDWLFVCIRHLCRGNKWHTAQIKL